MSAASGASADWPARLAQHEAVSGALDEVLRQEGAWHLRERDPAAAFAGLGNQGATCYLNSLLQVRQLLLSVFVSVSQPVNAWRTHVLIYYYK